MTAPALPRPAGRSGGGWVAALGLLVLAAAALWAIVHGVQTLEGASSGLTVTRQRLGTLPVTIFRPANGPAGAAATAAAAAPVVLIAHGFAGSQQLMQPFATTLARNGYVAITFDQPGHGRNPAPLRGGVQDTNESQRVLLAGMDVMGRLAGQLAGPGGRYAVLGHSMASDIVVRHAQARPQVLATVGVSLFAPSIQAATPATSPRNLLVVAGALEPGMMAKEALRVVAQSGGPSPALGTTYGQFEAGTARRAALAPSVEHIGVLYSPTTLAESLAWLNQAFGRPPQPPPFIDARGPALGWLLGGVLLLAWPLSHALPALVPAALVAAQRPRKRTPWWRWPGHAPLVLLPALATPLILWKLPTDVLPLLLGDYLVLHFALYGLLSFGCSLLLPSRALRLPTRQTGAWLLATVLLTAYALLAVGVPVDRYLFNLQPESVRWPMMAAMLAGTLPYFLADEAITRDPAAPPAAYLVTKLCFLLSLVLAIALNPGRLFFLAIIVPAILVMFTVYGLLSRWSWRRTGASSVAAVANAVCFAWFIAVVFPMVG